MGLLQLQNPSEDSSCTDLERAEGDFNTNTAEDTLAIQGLKEPGRGQGPELAVEDGAHVGTAVATDPSALGDSPRFRTSDVSQATLSSVAPVFTVYLKAVITPECLLVLDYRHLNLERWLFRELPSQLAGEGQLVTYPLPFEFRAVEALLQFRVGVLQEQLSVLQPLILETLDALVDPKYSSVDRSKLHVLLQNGKREPVLCVHATDVLCHCSSSLSELETDIKIFKESILEILDDEEVLEELCLTKWTDPHVFEKSSAGIDHAEEMELLLENYHRLAEELSNAARELRALIDDSQSIIFINLDSHRNVMMRLNLQLTMGTFSLSLFGLMGVAFGMNLESSLEEDHRVFWLVTGIMFMGSGLIWRRLLSFLGRQLEAPLPPTRRDCWAVCRPLLCPAAPHSVVAQHRLTSGFSSQKDES
ncbi:Magnesium transporter MRS2 like protein, mitochondrial [Tupaia chinensis]|uniref:Magnesium transporter n=1 Tax=Tupaia chinensis TaxID=246437 RepID=L9L147_TUPCH|nr:Magnesium transporter MRS2 like protein, mitochondrial [Tupaia chinensis]